MIRVAGYPIDCALTERLSYEAEVTEHAVERGANITDHVRAKRPILEFEGVVSDTPIGAVAVDPSRQGTAQRASAEAFRRFVAVYEARQPVTVECSYGTFDLMVLASLTPTKDARNAKAFQFTATFRQIRIVENRRTTVRVAIPTGKRRNYGLSLDKVVDGKHVLWRKGKPPGTSPATDPPGVIVGQEVVHIVNGKLLHEDRRRPLSTPEIAAFEKDLDRDTRLMQLRAVHRAEQKMQSIDQRLAAAERLLAYKEAHPGENPDPALFGL